LSKENYTIPLDLCFIFNNSRKPFMQSITEFLAMFTPYILPAIGITLILYSIFKKSTEEKLKWKGVYTEGIMFSQSGSYDFSNAPDKITVRFTTQKMEWITTIAKNDFATFYTGQYKTGDHVKVLYNSDNPSECVIVTKQSEKTVRIILICLGFALCIIGLIKLFR
jgi:hypothetical protein